MVVTGCLSNCENSNTIVVVPSPAGRALGGSTVWFGRVLSDELTDMVSKWIEAGGPGIAQMPGPLGSQRVDPPRRANARANRSAE